MLNRRGGAAAVSLATSDPSAQPFGQAECPFMPRARRKGLKTGTQLGF